MDPATISAIVQGGIGLVNTIAGGIGEGKTEAELNRTMKLRPDYQIQKPILDNQAIEESRASHGLSDSTINNYQEFAQRGLSSSLDAILKGGGSMNNVGNLYGSYGSNERSLAILDDQARANNVRSLVDQNRELGGELDKQWEINKWAPWADKMQALNAKLKRQGAQFQSGLSTVASAASNYGTSKEYQKEGDSVYGAKIGADDGINPTHIDSANQIMENLNRHLTPVNNPQPRNVSGVNIPGKLRMNYPGLMGATNPLPDDETYTN